MLERDFVLTDSGPPKAALLSALRPRSRRRPRPRQRSSCVIVPEFTLSTLSGLHPRSGSEVLATLCSKRA
jgi:hypothetical protein